tara:strand:- start:5995 stop:6168 length:174 start_codon:yes stop_codon:yes gene_type:complete
LGTENRLKSAVCEAFAPNPRQKEKRRGAAPYSADHFSRIAIADPPRNLSKIENVWKT